MTLRNSLFVLLLALFAASGCIFSPEGGGGGDVESLLPAKSYDAAASAYQEIYEARDFESYKQLISQNFLWLGKEADENYDYAVEIARTNKMFNEIAGYDPDNDNMPVVISDIRFLDWDPQGVWTETAPNDENFGSYEGSKYRRYDLTILFKISGDTGDYKVQGSVLFYVMAEEENGQQVYKILGMKDDTNG